MGIAALWRSLPAPHRRWIVLNALLATTLINLVVNAVIAWLSVRGQADVPLWERPLSETSTIGDTLGTIFLLPLITCVLTTTVVRRDLRNGELPPLDPDHFAIGLGALVTPLIALCAMTDGEDTTRPQ